MKPAWVKVVNTEQERKEAMDSLLALSDKNLYDPNVLLYPSTGILKSFNSDKSLVFMPVHKVHMLESLGINPQATAMEVASGLKSLVLTVAYESRNIGIGELMFLCRDEQTAAFARAHGFEKVEIPLYRLKL